MTPLLEKAFARLTELTEPEQDTIASLILEEIEDEERWNASFARPESIALLSQMAEEALAESKKAKPARTKTTVKDEIKTGAQLVDFWKRNGLIGFRADITDTDTE